MDLSACVGVGRACVRRFTGALLAIVLPSMCGLCVLVLVSAVADLLFMLRMSHSPFQFPVVEAKRTSGRTLHTHFDHINLPRPTGIHYLGIGYDLRAGKPLLSAVASVSDDGWDVPASKRPASGRSYPFKRGVSSTQAHHATPDTSTPTPLAFGTGTTAHSTTSTTSGQQEGMHRPRFRSSASSAFASPVTPLHDLPSLEWGLDPGFRGKVLEFDYENVVGEKFEGRFESPDGVDIKRLQTCHTRFTSRIITSVQQLESLVATGLDIDVQFPEWASLQFPNNGAHNDSGMGGGPGMHAHQTLSAHRPRPQHTSTHHANTNTPHTNTPHTNTNTHPLHAKRFPTFRTTLSSDQELKTTAAVRSPTQVLNTAREHSRVQSDGTDGTPASARFIGSGPTGDLAGDPAESVSGELQPYEFTHTSWHEVASEMLERRNYVLLYLSESCWQLHARLQQYFQQRVSGEFSAAVGSFPREFVSINQTSHPYYREIRDEFASFFEEYGTHMVHSVHLGGLRVRGLWLQRSDWEALQEVDVGVYDAIETFLYLQGAPYNTSDSTAAADSGTTKNVVELAQDYLVKTTLSKYRQSREYFWSSVGGLMQGFDPYQLEFDNDEIGQQVRIALFVEDENLLEQYEFGLLEWAEALETQMMPVQYALVPLYTVMPGDTLSAVMRLATIEYMSSPPPT